MTTSVGVPLPATPVVAYNPATGYFHADTCRHAGTRRGEVAQVILRHKQDDWSPCHLCHRTEEKSALQDMIYLVESTQELHQHVQALHQNPLPSQFAYLRTLIREFPPVFRAEGLDAELSAYYQKVRSWARSELTRVAREAQTPAWWEKTFAHHYRGTSTGEPGVLFFQHIGPPDPDTDLLYCYDEVEAFLRMYHGKITTHLPGPVLLQGDLGFLRDVLQLTVGTPVHAVDVGPVPPGCTKDILETALVLWNGGTPEGGLSIPDALEAATELSR